MKKTLRALAGATLGLCVVPAAQAALFAAQPDDLAAEAQAAARDGKRLAIVVKLGDCGSCEKMEKHVFSRRDTETEFARRFRTVAVDLAQPAAIVAPDGRRETPESWAKRVGVFSAPAFVFVEADGSLRYRHQGELANRDFVRLGRYVAEAGFETAPFRASPAAPTEGRRDGR